MTVWCEGCTMQRGTESFDGLGSHHVGVVERMPGMTKVELVEEGADLVTIRTNEGLVMRTNISKRFEAERVVVEFDETYRAGSRVTTTSHFCEEFTNGDGGVTLRTVVSDVEASGLLGFFHRRFGSSKMGKAFSSSHKASLESSCPETRERRVPTTRRSGDTKRSRHTGREVAAGHCSRLLA